MKKVLLLILTIILFGSQEQSLANTVIVRGYVKDSTGNAVANRTVKVFTNDSSQGCIFTHIVTTNPNGYYTDTISCNKPLTNLFVKVEDCKGQWVIKNPAVTGAGDLEINFVICRPGTAPAPCKALFQYTVTETGIKFSSTPSGIAAGDSIISRTWVFGDSSNRLTGNQADPWHEYKKAGSYTVCLTISTRKGCESNYCKTIVYQPKPADSCSIKPDISLEKLAPRKFRFSSKTTTVATGDTIIKRIWSFGDGTGHEGNEISPVKEYKDTGAYQVCVKIKTKKGCEKQFCFVLMVRDSVSGPVPCKAVFTFQYKDTIAYFNSAASAAAPGDSIISRTWFYVHGNDTLKLGGNVIDTFMPYTVPGKYTVFLTIKTRNGCSSTFSGEVKIPEPPCNIQLAIRHEKTAARKIRFSSSQSIAAGDSIIRRKWKFGDGSIFEGNEPSPVKEYKDTGVFTVCLYIKTKKGCEKETCIQVWVKDSTAPAAGCKAQFSFSIHDKTVRFNSAASAAPAGDSIISRTWIFGDSSQPLTNRTDPSYTYAKAGVYTVYLYIKTKNGCESKQKAQIVLDSIKPATGCKAQFTSTIQDKTVRFNSAGSIAPAGDSIVSRTWIFGDSSQPLTNRIDPSHTYTNHGVYTVYLYIKTRNGCESKQATQVYLDSVKPAPCKIQPRFTIARVSGKKILFNSMQTIAQPGDSIVSRKWNFGDGSTMDGNNETPVKEYNRAGTLTACLIIKTKKGCEASVCATVSVLDSIPPVLHAVKIISLNPNPVTTRMLATISSSNMNTETEIAVIDIYGTVKFSFKKILSQGNNIVEVITANLPKGPYFLKLSSKGSRDSRLFYKF